jgi:hypothetical protein
MDYSLLFAIEHNIYKRISRKMTRENSTESAESPYIRGPTMHSTVFNRQFSVGSTGEYAKSRHKFISSCGNFIYHLGIIDYLQEFNMDKIAENKFKTFSNWKTGHLISAINAIDYQKRFVDFMREEVIIE